MTYALDVWTTVEGLMGAPIPIYRDPLLQAIKAHGLNDLPFGMALHVYQLEGEGFTLEKIMSASPNFSPVLLKQRVDTLVEAGFAEAIGDGAYRSTDKTKNAFIDVFGAAEVALAAFEEQYSFEGIVRLRELMDRLNTAALAEPDDNIRLRMQNNYPLDERKSHLSHLNDVAANLHNFRLDVHFRALQALDVSGPAQEVLGLLWREQANAVDGVVEGLGQRGYTAEDYAGYLDELVAKGYATKQADDTYVISDAGVAARVKVEQATDAGFFKIWEQELTEDDVAELGTLAQALIDHIQARLPKQEPA